TWRVPTKALRVLYQLLESPLDDSRFRINALLQDCPQTGDLLLQIFELLLLLLDLLIKLLGEDIRELFADFPPLVLLLRVHILLGELGGVSVRSMRIRVRPNA